MAINGTAIAITSVGGLLIYSAVKGAGIGDTARSLLAGKAVSTSAAGSSGTDSLQSMLTDPLTSGGTAPAPPPPYASPGATTPGSVGVTGSAAPINTYLKGMNFSRAQRAGIMGNMQIESGFNPNSYNAIEGAIGLCQWEKGRRTALQAYAHARGKSETDLDAQLGFFHLEMNSAFAPVQVMIRASNNPATVATIVDSSYERSAGTSRAARISAAQSLFTSDVTA